MKNNKRPSKNQVVCPIAHRLKMLFKTEQEANLFILYNGDKILEETGFAPVRAYQCKACGGWHLTSREKHRHDEKFGEVYDRETLQHRRQVAKARNLREKMVQADEYVHLAVNCVNLGMMGKAQKHCQKAMKLLKYCISGQTKGRESLKDIESKLDYCADVCFMIKTKSIRKAY